MKYKFLIYTLVFLFAVLFIACRDAQKKRSRSTNNSRTDTEEAYTQKIPTEDRKPSSFASDPDEQKIKYDLAGKIIMEPTRKAYRSKFQVRSAKNVLNVDILSKEKDGNQTLYRVRLKLNDDINTYLADINITYIWDNREWTIQYLESKYLDIVPTGKFDNCIIVKKEPYLFSEYLFFYNNCDVALLVEGRIFTWSSDGMRREWRDYAIDVAANGKAQFHYESDADYKIERIERP